VVAAQLVVIVPVLRRPHRVVPLLESIEATTPEPHRVLFMCTTGDTAEIDAVNAAGAEHIDIEYETHGDYARKINLGYGATTEPLLFLGADDLRFHPGWLEQAVAAATVGVGVVGTNDLGNARVKAGRHATHSLVTRSYVDEHGTIDEHRKILHEGYRHNFVDDELVATAKLRDAWAFAPHSIVEHQHPDWSKASRDEVYDLGQSGFTVDRRLFLNRQQRWGFVRG
jgi:hypothetical protein